MQRKSQRGLPICRAICSCLVTVCLVALLAAIAGCNGPKQEPVSAEDGSPKPGELTSAREVLEAMVAAYKKASSYADNGTVRLKAEVGDEKIDDQAAFSVALVRPNKLCLRVYQAVLVCDGEQMHASLSDMPDQMLAQDGPAVLTRETVYADQLLAAAMQRGVAGESLPLILLLEKDALKHVLRDAEEPVLAEPQEIDGHQCYCVQIKWPFGIGTFSIDQETYVLRRVTYPTGGVEEQFGGRSAVKNASLVANFADARLGGKVDPERFQFEVPPGADLAKFLMPPHPGQVLARRIRQFRFFDLENNPVSAESLAGKIVVVSFWATGSAPSLQRIRQIEKVHDLYKDKDNIVFLAVNADLPPADPQALGDAYNKLGVHLTLLRDPEGHIVKAFRVPVDASGMPNFDSMFILDGRGILQDFQLGANPDPAAWLTRRIEKLLAGENVYQKPRQDYRDLVKRAEKRHGKPQAAPRSEPSTLKLTRLWHCPELKAPERAPGNILVVDDPKGKPRLLVVEGRRSVAEVGLDGRPIATHALDIDPEREQLSALRTAVGADGKRYFVALRPGEQRIHLFDDKWKKLLSFPEDALDNPHAGIGDAAIADLERDGTPQVYIGYYGLVGVQAVSLEGKRIGSNRTVANVVRTVVADADGKGTRRLFCVSSRENAGALAILDGKLESQGDVIFPERPLLWAAAADLAGDGNIQWCALTVSPLGENLAIGLNLSGKQLWSYAMPEGGHQYPIEPVVAAQLTAAPPGQWVTAGVDGSIHVIAADGKPIDQFNYGAIIYGLAAVKIDGGPVLIVASPDGLEALRVD